MSKLFRLENRTIICKTVILSLSDLAMLTPSSDGRARRSRHWPRSSISLLWRGRRSHRHGTQASSTDMGYVLVRCTSRRGPSLIVRRRASRAFYFDGEIVALHLAGCHEPIKRRCSHGRSIPCFNSANSWSRHMRRHFREGTRDPILTRSLQTHPRRQRNRHIPLRTSSRKDHAREQNTRKHRSHRIHERDRGEQRRGDRCLQLQQSRSPPNGS